jgi:hypothetical protein
VVERDVSREMNLMSRADLKEHVCASLPTTAEDIVVTLQAAATALNANMIRRAQENVARCTATCLEKNGSNTLNEQVPSMA